MTARLILLSGLAPLLLAAACGNADEKSTAAEVDPQAPAAAQPALIKTFNVVSNWKAGKYIYTEPYIDMQVLDANGSHMPNVRLLVQELEGDLLDASDPPVKRDQQGRPYVSTDGNGIAHLSFKMPHDFPATPGWRLGGHKFIFTALLPGGQPSVIAEQMVYLCAFCFDCAWNSPPPPIDVHCYEHD